MTRNVVGQVSRDIVDTLIHLPIRALDADGWRTSFPDRDLDGSTPHGSGGRGRTRRAHPNLAREQEGAASLWEGDCPDWTSGAPVSPRVPLERSPLGHAWAVRPRRPRGRPARVQYLLASLRSGVNLRSSSPSRSLRQTSVVRHHVDREVVRLRFGDGASIAFLVIEP